MYRPFAIIADSYLNEIESYHDGQRIFIDQICARAIIDEDARIVLAVAGTADFLRCIKGSREESIWSPRWEGFISRRGGVMTI